MRNFETALKQFTDYMDSKVDISRNMPKKFIAKMGKKYAKIIVVDNQRSAYAFVDMDGKIWKSASWSAPAKNFPRANIFEPESYKDFEIYGI